MEDKKYGFYAENTEELNKRISEIEISMDDLETNGERRGMVLFCRSMGKTRRKASMAFCITRKKQKLILLFHSFE